jgi:hypothetical protein
MELGVASCGLSVVHPAARGCKFLYLHRLPSRVNGRVGRPRKGAGNGSLSCLTAVAARSSFILTRLWRAV